MTFMAVAAAVSGCSKASIVGKGNKVQVAPLSVLSIVPDSGPIAGGTQITITGTGFVSGTTVTIGGNPCGNLQILSPTQMTCVTASVYRGGVDSVDIANSLAANNSATFSYLEAIQAVGATISSGGVFGTSGTIQVRATIGAVSGVNPNNLASSSNGVIVKVGGLQGVIQVQNALLTGGSTP